MLSEAPLHPWNAVGELQKEKGDQSHFYCEDLICNCYIVHLIPKNYLKHILRFGIILCIEIICFFEYLPVYLIFDVDSIIQRAQYAAERVLNYYRKFLLSFYQSVL